MVLTEIMLTFSRVTHVYVVVLLLSSHCGAFNPLSGTFKGAVYEHAVILPPNRVTAVSREEALNLMMKNLEIYKTQTEAAAARGTDIIVFPEDGIYGMGITRAALEPYLEYIPDPKNEDWSPCTEPDRYPNTEVQFFLSCLAQNNSLYLVANFGDNQPCDPINVSLCPSDAHYQYNTDVVYNPKGVLVAKYHKWNLFYEGQFNQPPNPEHIFFDTPFGRFGLFTCFDILFKEPTQTLIERYNIGNIIFPTAWMDALPLLAAIQFHSAFSSGMGLNFLAANIHLPAFRFHGSGIYVPEGALGFYYNDHLLSGGQLLIHDVPIIINRRQSPNHYKILNMTHSKSGDFDEFNQIHNPIFQSLLFHDLFTFVAIGTSEGHVDVCQGRLCCHLEYEINSGSDDLFAFGAFDGLHTYQGQYYLQICTLVKCESHNRSTCGSATKLSKTTFKHFHIKGTFRSQYIFPEILLSNQGQLELAPVNQWHHHNGGLDGRNIRLPLLSASLFSRDYDLDNSTTLESTHKNTDIDAEVILNGAAVLDRLCKGLLLITALIVLCLCII